MRLGRADAVRVPGGIALQSRSSGVWLALAGRLRLILGRLPATVSTMPVSLSGLNTAASLSVRSFLSVRLGNAAITDLSYRTLLQFTSQGVRLVLQLQLSKLLRSSKDELAVVTSWQPNLEKERFFEDIYANAFVEKCHERIRPVVFSFFFVYNNVYNNDILVIWYISSVKCIVYIMVIFYYNELY